MYIRMHPKKQRYVALMFGVLAVAQPNGDSKFVEALYDYDATQEGDLGFKLGDKIEIIKDCRWIMHCSQSALCVVVHHMLCEGPRLNAYSVCCVVMEPSCLSLG